MKKTLLAAAACSFDLTTSSNQLVLIPEGSFRGLDGRPFDAPAWILTPELGHAIAYSLNQRNIDMVIDYEHSTLKAQETGEPAPAAGWLKAKGFTYIEGIGLCSSQFTWTEKAKGFIESEEYKYLSPVFMYNKNGEIAALLHVALTNTPNLDQLPEARLAAAAQDFLSQKKEDSRMEEFLKLMCKSLGLPETATCEELVTAANSAFIKFDGALGTTLTTGQTLSAAIDKAIELKTAANSQVDPSKFVPMSVYQEAIAKAGNAEAANKAKEIDDLITAACSDGRLTGEVTINWVKEQAKTNPDFVKTHIESLPKIAALTQKQTTTIDFNTQQSKPDELKDDVFSMLGVSQADVEKYGA